MVNSICIYINIVFLREKGLEDMVEVTVTVEYKGLNYQTNVLVNRSAVEEEIFETALRQVKEQWSPELKYQ